MSRRTILCWQFVCPECGFSDEELSCLAADDDIHCVVCLEETDRHVRLRRWTEPARRAEAAPPRFLAAGD